MRGNFKTGAFKVPHIYLLSQKCGRLMKEECLSHGIKGIPGKPTETCYHKHMKESIYTLRPVRIYEGSHTLQALLFLNSASSNIPLIS